MRPPLIIPLPAMTMAPERIALIAIDSSVLSVSWKFGRSGSREFESNSCTS